MKFYKKLLKLIIERIREGIFNLIDLLLIIFFRIKGDKIVVIVKISKGRRKIVCYVKLCFVKWNFCFKIYFVNVGLIVGVRLIIKLLSFIVVLCCFGGKIFIIIICIKGIEIFIEIVWIICFIKKRF